MIPNKANKKNRKISCWCTATEKRYIEIRAREYKFSASEYLRELGLKDYPKREPTLRPEVLAFTGQLYQLAAALWPLTRRRLDNEDLSAFERAKLQQLIREITQLVNDVKGSLQ